MGLWDLDDIDKNSCKNPLSKYFLFHVILLVFEYSSSFFFGQCCAINLFLVVTFYTAVACNLSQSQIYRKLFLNDVYRVDVRKIN